MVRKFWMRLTHYGTSGTPARVRKRSIPMGTPTCSPSAFAAIGRRTSRECRAGEKHGATDPEPDGRVCRVVEEDHARPLDREQRAAGFIRRARRGAGTLTSDKTSWQKKGPLAGVARAARRRYSNRYYRYNVYYGYYGAQRLQRVLRLQRVQQVTTSHLPCPAIDARCLYGSRCRFSPPSRGRSNGHPLHACSGV